MPPPTINDTLAANLACLGDRNASIAEAIAQSPPCEHLVFDQSKQGDLTATRQGHLLASQHHPVKEGTQFVEDVDLAEHAAFVICGFGLGYHVQALAKRLGRKGLIIVFENDLSLLRDVLSRIDHSQWLKNSLVLFANNAQDRGELGRLLHGADAILGQGVNFIEHPSSRAHLGTDTLHFTSMMTQYIGTVRTTLMTTMVKSVDTTRNLLGNIACYANANSIDDLADVASGVLGIVVSAGPSLRKNIELLQNKEVRSRVVITAVQTALKPLLTAGIRPDFVTALDYHEISRRFYEDLPAEELKNVTLVIDPKVHPGVAEAYPGPITSLKSNFLEAILKEDAPGHRSLPASATVAHLAFLVTKFLGCNPIAMIGQDLGFTDGLYYAPGTAIHDVWASELNAFNTIEMMEWERIARHRQHLSQIPSIDGGSLYTDGQMLAYLHQFERLFEDAGREGITVIDATEGGALKQHTTIKPLQRVLDEHTNHDHPPLPKPTLVLQPIGNAKIIDQLKSLSVDLITIRDTAKSTHTLVETMLKNQDDAARMKIHFSQLNELRKKIETRKHAFNLLSHLNQLGAMQRMRADRQISLMEQSAPLQRQRAQLLRDQANVALLSEAAQTLWSFTQNTIACINSEMPYTENACPVSKTNNTEDTGHTSVAALITIIDQADLDQTLNGQPVLQWTLERLGRSNELDKIIVLSNPDLPIRETISTKNINVPVAIEYVTTPMQIDAGTKSARLFANWCWRGGLGGNTIYDELLHVDAMVMALKKHALHAGVLVNYSWPLVDVSKTSGIDAVVNRFRSHAQQNPLVFTQAPPGLGNALITTELLEQYANRTGVGIGSLLAYRPAAPRHDPITSAANVQIDYRLRRPLIRASCDTARGKALIEHALSQPLDIDDPLQVVTALTEADQAVVPCQPQHVILELTMRRATQMSHDPDTSAPQLQPDLTLALAERLIAQLESPADTQLTLGGRGDPLLFEDLEAVIAMAVAAGVGGIHICTDLLDPPGAPQRLLAAAVDVISVNLNANTKNEYRKVMGVDRFEEVLANIDDLLSGQTSVGRWPTPWVVPRIRRGPLTVDHIDAFYDTWITRCGAAMIDPSPTQAKDTDRVLLTTTPPSSVLIDRARREMTILCDGSAHKHDAAGQLYYVGSILTDSLAWLHQLNSIKTDSQQAVW